MPQRTRIQLPFRRAVRSPIVTDGIARTRDVPVTIGDRTAVVRNAAGELVRADTAVLGGRPDSVGFDTLDEMRRDPTVSACLTLIKAPIIAHVRRSADVECADPAVAAFVRRTVVDSGLLSRAVRSCLSALDFGVAVHEKVWTVEDVTAAYPETNPDTGETIDVTAYDGPAATLKDLRLINPGTVRHFLRRTEARDGQPGDGSFDGFVQRGQQGGADVEVPAPYAFVYAHGSEFGNLWGVPRTRAAFGAWFWLQVVMKQWVAWVERKASPTRTVRFPPGIDPVSGLDNATVATQIGNRADAVSALAIPSLTDPNGKPLWDVGEIVLTDRGDVFERAAARLTGMIYRAIFAPQRAVENAGETGTYAEAREHADTFLLTEDDLLFDVLDAVSRYVVRPLIELNLGADAPPARITCPGLTDDERTFLRDVLTTALIDPEARSRIDLDALAERYALPLREQAPIRTEVDAVLEPENEDEQQDDLAGDSDDDGLPPNLVLDDLARGDALTSALLLADDGDDALIVALAAGLADLSRYRLTPDGSAVLGYRVIDTTTGKRLTGFAAMKVIDAFQKRAAREAKRGQQQAESAARKAARAADAEVKKQEREAAKAQRAAERESAKAQRAAAKAQRDQEREAERTARETERAQAATERATAANAQRERAELEGAAHSLRGADADRAITAAGWQAAVGAAVDRVAAVARARQVAEAQPDVIVSVVRTGDGYRVVKKPKRAIGSAAARPDNLALVDRSGVPASTPDDVAAALIATAERRIADLFTSTPPDGAEEEYEDGD